MAKLKTILSLLLIIWSANMAAQSVDIAADIDTNMRLIGDQSKLTIEISHPQNIQLTLPSFADTIIKNIEIIDQSQYDTISTKNGYIQLRKELTITSFDSNLYYIPPFEVKYMKDDEEEIAVSNSLSFHVFSIPIDTTNSNALFDIKAIKKTPLTFEEFLYYVKVYLPYIISLVLLIGLIVFVVLYFERKKAKELNKVPSKPKEPADIIAMRELEKLKKAKLLDKGKSKEYHSWISEIIRRYLENRYGVIALEEASSNILKLMKTKKIVAIEEMVCLKDILSISDLVKFAKYQPNDYENETIYKNALNFVEKTKFVKQDVNEEIVESK